MSKNRIILNEPIALFRDTSKLEKRVINGKDCYRIGIGHSEPIVFKWYNPFSWFADRVSCRIFIWKCIETGEVLITDE